MTAARSPIPEGLNRMVEALARRQVDCVICGGFACIIHGVQRVTADIDLALKMDDETLRRFILVARELDLKPRVPEALESLCDEGKRREWIERKNARVFTLIAPDGVLQIDVFLEYPVPYAELRACSHEVRVAGHTIHVSSKEHLIRAKQTVQPPRKVDLRDIEDLKELIEREREPRQ